MSIPLRGELTNASHVEKRFEFSNNEMVLGVAQYLNATNHEEIEMIKNSLSPVLLNSVASTVSVINGSRNRSGYCREILIYLRGWCRKAAI